MACPALDATAVQLVIGDGKGAKGRPKVMDNAICVALLGNYSLTLPRESLV